MDMLATPKAATAYLVSAGPKVEMARGRAASKVDESHKREATGESVRKEKKARAVSPAVETMVNPGGASSGSGRTAERVDSELPQPVAETQLDEELSPQVQRWRKREGEVLKQHEAEGADAKKAEVGDQYIGALYNPTEDDEEAEISEEHSADHVVNIPATAEEEREAKDKELAKIRKKTLDSTWVVIRKPDGAVKARYCLREYKKDHIRDDVYVVATTLATSRIIDYLAVECGYSCFTADATNAFWQVPISEECYMDPPKEWMEKRAESGEDTQVKWKLLKE